MKEIEIYGVVQIPETETHQQFYQKFIDWIESQNYLFGGGIDELDKDGVPIYKKLKNSENE